jgi:glycosyltransferase involved in cell wall biosynthesis
MKKVTFLLAKDPSTDHGGDIELARVAMRLAAQSFDVSAICLSRKSGPETVDVIPGGLPLVRVPKPPVEKRAVFLGSLRKMRSLVHVRFDTEELRAAIEADDTAEVFVAEHSYMAESLLRTSRVNDVSFVINTVNTESQVWMSTRGMLGRIEAPRLLRDEVRVAREAAAVGCYEIEEAQMYRDAGVPNARFMEVTLAPKTQIDVSSSPRRLVFMGTRDWPPNQEAFLVALRLWPKISADIPDAELCVIGAKKPGAVDPEYPKGVADLGFVEDLPAFLNTCRALMAPIKTGGGVRVKILDAISLGLPVIGTTAANGSLPTLFDLPVYDDEDAFVEQCRKFLLDRDAAVEAGNRLFEANRAHWEQGRPHRAVADLVQAGLR